MIAEVVKVAKAVGEPIADPWKRCQALEKWVDENMKSSDFTVGFSTAADTVRSRRGDCSEHSVLLTALCRAAGVPSRAAMGLVYVDSLQAFGYHMWTEVNIGGEWYALDGTIGEGSVGGEHLKILDGSLKGASAMGACSRSSRSWASWRSKSKERSDEWHARSRGGVACWSSG